MSGLLRVVLVVVAVAGVAACGWHIRGSGQSQLTDQPLTVESRMGSGELPQLTRRSLRRVGARTVGANEEAPVLELMDERTSRRTIATDDDGRASAWELTYRLRFALRPPAGEGDGSQQALIPTRSVAAEETYEAEPQDTLAEQAQRERLTEELRAEAVRLMLSQVATALRE